MEVIYANGTGSLTRSEPSGGVSSLGRLIGDLAPGPSGS